MTSTADDTFRERARYEAARYGADAWVFVRELLQNARDAGAKRVWFETGRVEDRDRVICRDDGDGMTFEHARRYLFTLYASSKRDRSGNAGRFGIGFWSVLRFAPDSLVVRSRSRNGAGWQLSLDGDLDVLSISGAAMERGTEVVLERPADATDIARQVREAVLRDAPFLSCRGGGDRPLAVRVNGQEVRAELELSPPSLGFRRRGLHGAVGLAEVPRVEIFAHGLRVRDAASLEELLLAGGRSRPSAPVAAAGLAPTALIDSRQLSVLMARGDAREDRALRRLVAIGNRELRRLVRVELDRHTRANRALRVLESLRELWTSSPWVRYTAAAALLVASFLVWAWIGTDREPGGSAPGVASQIAGRPSAEPDAVPYRSLDGSYRGPDVQAVAASPAAVDLRYRPREEGPYFAVLAVTGRDEAGYPAESAAGRPPPYAGAPCTDRCLDIELEVAAGPGRLRLPLATGHAIDPDAVRLDGVPATVLADDDGRPLLLFERPWEGLVSYRSGPVKLATSGLAGDWPPLPPEFAGWVDLIADLGPTAAAASAVHLVARRVRYDASPAVIERHRAARERGLDIFERAVEVGAGDCDVQNAMVAAMLTAAGVPAHLAVGWVGVQGRVLPGLHAWVEFVAEDGSWQVADASVTPHRTVPAAPDRPPAALVQPEEIREIQAARVAVLLLAGATAVLFLRGRWHRELRPGSADDIAGLLRGAASRPAVFAGAGRLFTRRVVPLVGGRRVSLERAQSVARRGRLGTGAGSSELAARAAAAGGLVLDGSTAAGAAVAGALGAVDLDEWQELLDRSWTTSVTEAVGRAMTEAGEPCRLRVAHAVGEEMAVLVGPLFGLAAIDTWLLVDAGAEVWRAVSFGADARPARAALVLGEAVIERLGVPFRRRRRALAALAREALLEAGGGPA